MDYHSNEYGDSAECKLFRGRNLHLKADDCSPLRCPACLRAEEAANGPNGEMPSVTVEPWEGNEYVLCVDGSPTGGTLSREDAYSRLAFLQSGVFQKIIDKITGPKKEG
jgi:hypothetical protein